MADDPESSLQTDQIFRNCRDALSTETDSYVYLSVIQCLEALTMKNHRQILPVLAAQFCGMSSSAETNTSEKLTVDVRCLLGETLIKVTRRLGPIATHYSSLLINSLMFLIRDKNSDVRTSGLSALADVCRCLRYSIFPVRMEILNCLRSVYETDKVILNKRAAIYTLGEIVEGLGKDFVEIYGDCSRIVWRLLRIAALDEDDAVRIHAQKAVDLLDSLPRLIMFNGNEQMRVISQRSLKKL